MFAPSSVSLQPISSLSPFIGRWFIKARVLDKSTVKEWKNNRGMGRLFSMTLVDDNEDAIRATVFQEGVAKYYDFLQNGQVYIFSNGTVKSANKKFNSLPADYELSFDEKAEITAADDDGSISREKFTFVTIAHLVNKEKNAVVDICGVVLEIGDVQQIVTKTQDRLDKRVLTVADNSGVKVELTLWNQQANDFYATVGTVAAFKACRVGDYAGISLSLTQQGSVSIEPTHPFADAVRQWVKASNGQVQVESLTQRTMTAEGGQTERRTFAAIATDGLGLGEKADWITVRGTLVHIKADQMWYLACPNAKCNRKLNPDPSTGALKCEKCEAYQPNPKHRYVLTCQVYDHTGSQQVTAFQEVAQALLKVPADELDRQEQERAGTCHELTKSLCFQQYVMRLRVKEEGPPEDRRLKCVLQSFQPMNPATESTVLLRQIRRYLAL